MGVKWTDEQKKAIDLRNRNILVSAAAGSGKTAVLVERIIKLVTDEENPVNVDRLLVVTFTKAAAAEMKERVRNAINKEIDNNPDNENLKKQMLLIHNANITTIDSFCLNVVKNYFSEIDLNPGFRIADEHELKLLKKDVVNEVLEKYYEENEDDFIEMIDRYSSRKSDKNIEDIILKLHDTAISNAWPKEWLLGLKNKFDIDYEKGVEEFEYYKALKEYVDIVINDIIEANESLLKMCETDDGPKKYIPALLEDSQIYNSIVECKTYSDYQKCISNISYGRLSTKKEDCSKDKVEFIKANRNRFKKLIEELKKKFFDIPEETVTESVKEVGRSMNVLVDVTIDFLDEFLERKLEKNIIDFSDMEHFALEILTREDEETHKRVPTKVAEELSEYYEEIIIDEYQDSNYVQEAILNSISKEKYGKPNIFMVGDVKQSIYKFRMSKPEIFMGKYGTYTLNDSLYQRVDLKQNFRSRKCVLNSINYIFNKVMQEKFGGIEYDEMAALYWGFDYPEDNEAYSDCSEVIIVQKQLKDETPDEQVFKSTEQDNRGISLNENSEETEEIGKKELEVRAIAKRIKELVNPDTGLMVIAKDENGEQYSRIANYGDIAILFRAVSGWEELLNEIFVSEGIPLHIESTKGYFSAIEVKTILNFLKVINNPRQDIPLMAVLVSAIGLFTNNEIAIIREKFMECDLYTALTQYADADLDDNKELCGKIQDFLGMIQDYRKREAFMPVHEFVEMVIKESGYYDYVYAMPMGDMRRMNLDVLIQKAIGYEKTSYNGLFNFIRYIEQINKYDIDFGKIGTSGADDNCVKVMTIHKSKGLEFPIVFVGGMGQKFNNADVQSNILIHSDYGLAPDYIDRDNRIKRNTLIKSIVSKKIVQENIAEELRILYVALTRAREKLILTGYLDNVEKKLAEYDSVLFSKYDKFSYNNLCSVGTYFAIVMPALLKHTGFRNKLIQNFDIDDSVFDDNFEIESSNNLSYDIIDCKWELQLINEKDIIIDEVEQSTNKFLNVEYMREWEPVVEGRTSDVQDILSNYRNFQYEYLTSTTQKGKYSVSDLKFDKQLEKDEEVGVIVCESEVIVAEYKDVEETADNKDVEETAGSKDAEKIASSKDAEEIAGSKDAKEIASSKDAEETAGNKDIEETAGGKITDRVLDTESDKERYIPRFMRDNEETETAAVGSKRGTAYHKIMEMLEFDKITSEDDIIRTMQLCLNNNLIDEEQYNSINPKKILQYFKSNLGKRSIIASEKKKIFKEKQFFIGVDGHDIIKELDINTETLLVQGIIDMFFEEDGEWVLVDYKTDFVRKEEGEEKLINLYRKQLDYYKKAIEQLTRIKVKECYIYSFSLDKDIKL